ncbi:hypothetical protein QT327_00390 [Olivibacter sp. 47]|uniref:hypothetical protein n=1 Tax=Olivibacter sp. 47 TaxID=3056486 RepID=UPI0025A40B66|nr:hypothetical protein [Olivibacter sp. 47]MDM8172817.1 hypothetical protein [Olivibacter sp. 47]
MQGKLFDDNRQLVLPRELMDYTPDFLERREADTLLTFLLHNVPGDPAAHGGIYRHGLSGRAAEPLPKRQRFGGLACRQGYGARRFCCWT